MEAKTKTTRLPLDLLEAAEAEGLEEQRSTAKQIEHWARFGMYFERLTSASRRRIQQAMSGDLPLGDLSPEELLVANAGINSVISERANATSFADRLAARGVTTVGMDEDGRLVRRLPDGTVTLL